MISQEASERSTHDKQVRVTVLARQKSGESGAKTEERNVTQSFDASPLGRVWLRGCVSVARWPWLGATERNLQPLPGRLRLPIFPTPPTTVASHTAALL